MTEEDEALCKRLFLRRTLAHSQGERPYFVPDADCRDAAQRIRELSVEVQQGKALAEGAEQVLQDMGLGGRSCCDAAKALLRYRLEPFKNVDLEGLMPLSDAEAFLRDIGWLKEETPRKDRQSALLDEIARLGQEADQTS